MAVNGHHRHRVVAPAKRREVAEQHAQVLAAAEAGGTPQHSSPWLALLLTKVHERLERTANAAEQDNQRLAVAFLSVQQLRASAVCAILSVSSVMDRNRDLKAPFNCAA